MLVSVPISPTEVWPISRGASKSEVPWFLEVEIPLWLTARLPVFLGRCRWLLRIPDWRALRYSVWENFSPPSLPSFFFFVTVTSGEAKMARKLWENAGWWFPLTYIKFRSLTIGVPWGELTKSSCFIFLGFVWCSEPPLIPTGAPVPAPGKQSSPLDPWAQSKQLFK